MPLTPAEQQAANRRRAEAAAAELRAFGQATAAAQAGGSQLISGHGAAARATAPAPAPAPSDSAATAPQLKMTPVAQSSDSSGVATPADSGAVATPAQVDSSGTAVTPDPNATGLSPQDRSLGARSPYAVMEPHAPANQIDLTQRIHGGPVSPNDDFMWQFEGMPSKREAERFKTLWALPMQKKVELILQAEGGTIAQWNKMSPEKQQHALFQYGLVPPDGPEQEEIQKSRYTDNNKKPTPVDAPATDDKAPPEAKLDYDPAEMNTLSGGAFETLAGAIIDELEGGYVNNPDDRGGETKFGISKKSHPDVDIKNLTKEEALRIYKQKYWDAIGADQLPDNMRALVFDAAIHSGPAKALEMYKESGGDPQKFIDARRQFLQNFAENNPSQKQFLAGWMARMDKWQRLYDANALGTGRGAELLASNTSKPAAKGGDGQGGGSPDGVKSTSAADNTNKFYDDWVKSIQDNYKSAVEFGNKLFGENSALEQRFHDLIDKVKGTKDPSESNPWAAALMGMINPQMAQQYVQGKHAEVLKSFNDRMSRIQKYEEAILEKRYEHELASRNYKAAAETTRQMQLNAVAQARASHLTSEAESERKRASDREMTLARINGQKAAVEMKLKGAFTNAGVDWTETDRKQFMDFYKEISRMNDMGLSRYQTAQDVFDEAMARMLQFKGLTSLPSSKVAAADNTNGGGGDGSEGVDGLDDATNAMRAKGAMPAVKP